MQGNSRIYFEVTILFIILTLTAADCLQATAQTINQYTVTPAFPNLTFNNPDGIYSDPTNSNRLFVTEQTGTIKAFNNTENTSAATIFLDIKDKVLYGGEQGLLGLAFHPNYTQNGYFYLNYVSDNPRRTVIARYTVNPNNPDTADPNSQQVILEIPQPYSNHKGGQLAFGLDGYLYIGVGDGGSEGDPNGNGQSRQTLLGKILRIDVNSASAARNYTIPASNPYSANNLGYREEIYAYGFRNPWRFSFDSTGQLWVADVGQDRVEEIDVVEAGKNYGWNTMEGTLCFNPPSDCNQTGLTYPIYNYTHDLGDAIIGGYIYHGQANPSLKGSYIYGDYGSGRIWALTTNKQNPSNTQLADSELNIASFGLDQNNELYFTAYDGKIYTLTNTIPEYPQATQLLIIIMSIAAVSLFVKLKTKRSARVSH